MSSKKNKKSKGVTMSLGDFVNKVEEGTGAPTAGAGQNIVYADKKKGMPTMSSWADEVEEDGAFFEKERIILPSAPRASRGPAYADHEIPQNPPFTAHLGNLPYDIDEEEIFKFFRDVHLMELKLPRDQQTQRLRGFGYAEFETREDLIEALIRNEQMMRGRPIRITLGNGQQDRRGGDMDRGGMRGDGDRRRGRPPAEDDEVDDWRSMMKPQDFQGETEFKRGPPPGDYDSMPRSGFRDRGYGIGPPRGPRGPPSPQEEIEFSRDQMVQGPPPPQPAPQYNAYGGKATGTTRGGYNRDRGDREYYDRGDRYGSGGSDFYRGGPPPHQPQQGHYPAPSQHSRHLSESSDHGGASREETWRRREHTLSQSSLNNYHAYPSAPPPPRSERSESPPIRQHLQHRNDRARSPSSDRDRSLEESGSPSPGPPPPPKERKRLVLQPRTVDKPVGETEAGVSTIFGGAKPVDTQRREREIEEKLEKLKVVEEPKHESSSAKGDSAEESSDMPPDVSQTHEQGSGSGGASRDHRERSGDVPSRGSERPKQFRLLTRANSGGGSKEAYIELDSPVNFLGGSDTTSDSAPSSALRARVGGPMRAPPPLPITSSQTQQAYSSQRFNFLRSDEKDRGSSFRGRSGGVRRGGDMDRAAGGRGGDFRRGPRDHDGTVRGGRSYDRDHGGARGTRGAGYNRDGDYGERRREDRDDFRRGPSHFSTNQSASIGSQSEERDRDSHSEPEDDRDMMRGPSDKGHGDFSDDDSGAFTRVEHRRGRKSYNNRTSSNQMGSSSTTAGTRPHPSRGTNDRW